jgi:integrase
LSLRRFATVQDCNRGITPAESLAVLTLTPVTPATTLSEAAEAFLSSAQVQVALGRMAPATERNLAFGLRFLGQLGDVSVGNLRRSQVLAWAEQVAMSPGERKPLCRARDRVAVSSLKALLRWCSDRDACVPGLATRVPIRYAPASGRALQLDQLQAIRAELVETEARLDLGPDGGGSARLLRILADTGARISSIRLARRDWVSVRRKALVQPRGKTGRPVVVFLGLGLEVVQRQLATHDSDWLFPAPRLSEGATSYSGVVRLLQRVAKRARLADPDNFTPHDFRHTFATLAHEAGCSIEEIACSLSHSSTATTRRFYLHSAVSPGARAVHDVLAGLRSATPVAGRGVQ